MGDFLFFMEENGKPVCLVCSQNISVLKGYSLKRHCQANHAKNYNNFQGQRRAEKIRELLTGLKKQQAVFSRSREASDAAVKASYIIANKIASASKQYSGGDLTVAEIACPRKWQAFANISLTRNTVAEKDFGACWRCGPATYGQSQVIFGIFGCN